MPEFTSSSRNPEPHLWVTILAGGSGTRFWPASTPKRPKQLLSLAGDAPLIRETVMRARGLASEDRIRILAGGGHLGLLQAALGDMDPSCFLAEPQAKGTGPVLVWAAWTLSQKDPDAVLASLHADHAIRPWEAFHSLIREGADLAGTTRSLITVAVTPTRPEPGYGYIRPGESIPSGGEASAFRVDSFVEKPDRATAEGYLREGYLWNAGIFLWRADVFLEEVRSVAPELGDLLPLLDSGDVEGFFREAPSISVDEAVLERSDRVAAIRATFEWDDVGVWESLSRTRPADEDGNVTMGSVVTLDSRDNIVMAEQGDTVLFGVEGLVVVRSGEITLVAHRSRSADLKALVASLPPRLRDPEIP